jgi:hypothetical protein
MQKQDTAQPRLAPHLEEIAHVIRKKVDGKRREGFGTPNLIVRRSVSRLARLAGIRRLVSHSKTFTRALAELSGREDLRASQRREVETTVAAIARHLDIAGILPPPQKKKPPTPKRIKGVRRIKLNGHWLEEYGVEFGDRLLVAMTGDVKPGELGYFEVHQEYRHGEGPHYCCRSFYFLAERDETCRQDEWIPQAGVCLRGANYRGRCAGLHVGSREEPVLDDAHRFGILHSAHVFGRVVGVERDGRPVETKLPIRPYDGREAVTTTLDATPEPRRPDGPAAQRGASSLTPETKRRIQELRRRIEELDKDDEYADCNSPRRFQLEKEIYDLEHPTDPDWNNWSAWEE